MSVYVDRLRAVPTSRAWRWPQAAHLVADSEAELHAFAASIGLLRAWYQPRSFPHYDLTPSRWRRAVQRGAQIVERRELVAVMRRFREQPGPAPRA